MKINCEFWFGAGVGGIIGGLVFHFLPLFIIGVCSLLIAIGFRNE